MAQTNWRKVFALALGGLLVSSTAALAGDTECRDGTELTGTTVVGNLIVTEDATCNLTDVTI